MFHPNLRPILTYLGIALSATACSGIFNYDGGVDPTPSPGPSIKMAAKIEAAGMRAEAPAQNCIGPIDVKGKDTSGNDSSIASETTTGVVIPNQTGVDIFQDGNCLVSGNPTVPAGKSFFSFYFRSNSVQRVSFTLRIAGLEASTQPCDLYPGDPRAVVVKGSGRLGQNECMPVEAQLLDIKGQNVVTLTDRTLSLAPTGNLTAHSDPSCLSSTISNVSVLSNQDFASFYVMTTATSGSSTVGASDGVLTSQPLTVTSHPTEQVIYDREGAASGGLYSYCVLVNGRVKCWGDGSYMRLGDGTITDSSVPKDSLLGNGVTHVTLGVRGGCAIKGGAAYCWGEDTYGGLGDGATTVDGAPREVDGLGPLPSGVTQISRSSLHSCAIVHGGLKCWGYGDYGAIGNNATAPSNPSPVDVYGLGANSGVLGISVSGHWGSSYAIAADRSAWSWGHNGGGSLGIGSTALKSIPQPIGLPVGSNRVGSLMGGGQSPSNTNGLAGFSHACALVQGSPYCWGSNLRGAVGNGTNDNATLPVPLSSGLPSSTSMLALGGYYGTSLALRGGVLFTWGDGQQGSLLAAASTNLYSPTAAAVSFGQSEVIRPVPGALSTCYMKGDGLFCAGSQAFGQLGNGVVSSAELTQPARVSGIEGILGKISASNGGTCIAWNGKLFCAGANSYTQIGLPDESARVFRRISAIGFPNNVDHSAYGEQHSCAVASGEVFCLGLNTAGELGVLPSVTSKISEPRRVVMPAGVTGAVAVAVGDTHSCAVVSGSLYCWGSNGSGELGLGTKDLLVHEVPAKVTFANPSGMTATTFEVTDVAALGSRTCALVNGALACWGAGVASPAYVSGLYSGVSAMGLGSDHTCAVQSGKVFCFGSNLLGKLGNPLSVTESSVPLQVSLSTGGPLLGATAVVAGDKHTCAVAQGRVYCWGGNDAGQLGNPSLTDPAGQSSASEVSGTLGAVDVVAGSRHTCATVNGRLMCWGLNESGQLGNNGRENILRASTIALP